MLHERIPTEEVIMEGTNVEAKESSHPTLDTLKARIASLRDNLIPFCEKDRTPKAKRKLVEFNRELDNLKEIEKSLQYFCAKVELPEEQRDYPQIASTMGMLGPEDPQNCSCDTEEIKDTGVLGWIHKNHGQYNRAIQEIIAADPAVIPKLREVVLADVVAPSDDTIHISPLVKGQRITGPSVGKLLRKNYARDILVHFLKEHPDKKWVAVKKIQRTPDSDEE